MIVFIHQLRYKNMGCVGRRDPLLKGLKKLLALFMRRANFSLNRHQINKSVRKIVRKFCKYLIFKIYCGERGIRTPGGVTLNGFQDRRNRPLCHLSSAKGGFFSLLLQCKFKNIL